MLARNRAIKTKITAEPLTWLRSDFIGSMPALETTHSQKLYTPAKVRSLKRRGKYGSINSKWKKFAFFRWSNACCGGIRAPQTT